jgi:hypothetical protein
MQWSAKLNKIHPTKPIPRGAAISPVLLFGSHEQAFPTGKIFMDKFLSTSSMFQYCPHVWWKLELPEVGNLRDFSGQIVFLILPAVKVLLLSMSGYWLG